MNYWKPSDGERYMYMGDGKTIEVEVIENFIWLLKYCILLRS